MVVQQHCPVIVMLTRLVDNYKVLNLVALITIWFPIFVSVCINLVGLLEKESHIGGMVLTPVPS